MGKRSRCNTPSKQARTHASEPARKREIERASKREGKQATLAQGLARQARRGKFQTGLYRLHKPYGEAVQEAEREIQT